MAVVDLWYRSSSPRPNEGREAEAWSLCHKHGARKIGGGYDEASKERRIRCEITPGAIEGFRAAAAGAGYRVDGPC